MKNIILGLLMLTSLSAMAQQTEVETTLATMKGQIEKGKSITVSDKVVYTPGNEGFVLQVVQRWMKDSLSTVRSNAVVITGRLATFTTDGQQRGKAMDMLFKGCEDKDAGIGALAVQYLKQVKWQYFTSIHKASIGYFLREGQPSLEDYLYLAGYMYATDQAGAIGSLVSSGTLKKVQLWHAHLALARLGNKQSMNECISLANATPLGNSYIKVIVPGLIYTRQKTCTDLLVTLLKTNEKACVPSNPNYSDPIPCRYRIVEALASVVEGFPVKVTSEGDLVSDDYDGALQTAIKWFNGHGDYRFNDEL